MMHFGSVRGGDVKSETAATAAGCDDLQETVLSAVI